MTDQIKLTHLQKCSTDYFIRRDKTKVDFTINYNLNDIDLNIVTENGDKLCITNASQKAIRNLGILLIRVSRVAKKEMEANNV